MDIILRPEKPEDYREAEHVTREAFWNHHVPGCDEHYLLHIMRSCPAFVPELSIVALWDGKILGHVAYVKSFIHSNDGKEHEVLFLGPISVLPDYQGRGIGRRLIAHSKQLAREMGFRAIVLYGDPNYYTRQGFVPAETLGLRTADNMYAVALHVCELYENALLGIQGRCVEHEIYEVDAAAAALFDRQFPAKEKISGTPSQKWFEASCALRRPAES